MHVGMTRGLEIVTKDLASPYGLVHASIALPSLCANLKHAHMKGGSSHNTHMEMTEPAGFVILRLRPSFKRFLSFNGMSSGQLKASKHHAE